MNRLHKQLSLSIFLLGTLSLMPIAVEGKTIDWPDSSYGQDPEATLRATPANYTANSLFINSSMTDNTINLLGGTITGSVYASYASVGADATNSVVNMYGGTIGYDPRNFSGGYVAGGNSIDGNANGNTVNMFGGKVEREIYGGVTYSGSNASYNVVNMTGGEVGGIAGGYIANATIAGMSATHNTVNLSGGTVNGNIYGGDSYNGADTYNTVNISGTAVIAQRASIYGGNSSKGTTSHQGNTLNLAWAGKVRTVGSFEYYNFTVNDAVVANNNTALELTTAANIADSHIQITAFEGEHNWQAGDTITLLSKSTGTANLYDGSFRQGFARNLEYDMTTVGADNAVVARIIGAALNPDVGDIPAGTGSTNELLKGAAELVDSASLLEEIDGQSRIIGIVSHSRSKIGASSNANVNGTSMLLGASHKFEGQGGYITLGGFVEGGWGNYDTHSNFSTGASINSSGRSNYHGLGLALRNIRDNGVYTKATLRLGRAFTHYNSNNLMDSSGNLASYDTNSLYYGANLGIGKLIKLSEKNQLDIYGKYLFLHQNGSSVNILGDKFDFQAINSHRLNVGTKLIHQNSKALSSYLDLAYEYEFAGQSQAVVYGMALPYISTKGGTAIAELGIVYKPQNTDKFEMKLGVQGYVGKRQGFSGNVQFNWKF